jgi:geranylgeranyl diphosphate synthase type I
MRRSQDLIEPELRKAVDRLAEPVRTAVGYHFGWWDAQGIPLKANPGKGMRGALVLASAQALGAAPESAVTVAAAVELVHNFSVVHDDLMDGDATRRGRGTVWSVFGEPLAVLAGDALLALAIELMKNELPGSGGPAMMDELSGAMLRLVSGQATDLRYETHPEVDLAQCLAMAGDKTASLIAGACALGALSTGAIPERVSGMRQVGWHLGLAFQLVDDMLGIWGDTQVTGKPVGGDLRRRKKSLPVVAAMSGGTAAGRRLAELYRHIGPMPDAEIREAMLLVEQAGGRRWVTQESNRQRDLAFELLATLSPEPEGARALVTLARFVTDRDH